MKTELTIFTGTMFLALVEVLLPAMLRNRETDLDYNAGPCDAPETPAGNTTGRLMRA
ncbi:hypothetical protein [Paraburkholderia panacisoli]|uniref:hypothetical protein n=1 Tax=Paraburkholderia panacisoli TaxID=2603818 RepID=UPI00165FC821|nr:hypothetical protein [Paraburkholderia panacisoli]